MYVHACQAEHEILGWERAQSMVLHSTDFPETWLHGTAGSSGYIWGC